MKKESVTFDPTWMRDKRLTWPARILLAKLVRLTNEGKQPFVSRNCNAYFMEMMGFSIDEIKKAWNKLISAGYITKVTNKSAGNLTTINVVLDVANQITCSTEKATTGSVKNTTVGGGKATTGGVKNTTGGGKATTGVVEKPLSSYSSINNHSNTIGNTIVNTERVQNEKAEQEYLTKLARKKSSYWIDNTVKRTSFKPRQSLNYNKSLTTNFAVNFEKIPTAQVGRFYS